MTCVVFDDIFIKQVKAKNKNLTAAINVHTCLQNNLKMISEVLTRKKIYNFVLFLQIKKK